MNCASSYPAAPLQQSVWLRRPLRVGTIEVRSEKTGLSDSDVERGVFRPESFLQTLYRFLSPMRDTQASPPSVPLVHRQPNHRYIDGASPHRYTKCPSPKTPPAHLPGGSREHRDQWIPSCQSPA